MFSNEQLDFFNTARVCYPYVQFLRQTKQALDQHYTQVENQDILIGNIRLLMGLRDLTVERLSTSAGLNRSYVGRLLRKDFVPFRPDIKTLRAIAGVLGVKTATLILIDLRQKINETIGLIEENRL